MPGVIAAPGTEGEGEVGEVIEFPATDRNDPVARRERNRERATRLREKLDGKSSGRRMGREDQRFVAEALWRILDRTQSKGISRADVMRGAGIGKEGDSTKHLGQYAINPDWPEERKNKARLTQMPRPYCKIAEAAARLSGDDLDEVLIELFSKASLSAQSLEQNGAPEYEMLASKLRELAAAIAAKHKLQAYFKAVSQMRPSLSPLCDDVEPTGRSLEPDEIELEFGLSDAPLDWPIEFRAASEDVTCRCFFPPRRIRVRPSEGRTDEASKVH
jgi:cell fate (sporulation/competence/biofilm development) regulator YlbF (YheA/YmcA/DUF963 family)